MTDATQLPLNHDDGDDSLRLDAHMRQKAEEQFRRQMTQATQLLIRGKGKEALPLLERCYEIFPDDVDVLTNLGGARILAEQFQAAVPVLERASELDPGNPAVWMNLAAAYLGKMYTATRAKQNQALDAYRRAVEIEPHYPNVHYNMGLIYIDQRAWGEAQAAFTHALAANPHDQDARRMLDRVEMVLNSPPSPQNN